MAALFARLWLSRSVTDPVGLTVAKPFRTPTTGVLQARPTAWATADRSSRSTRHWCPFHAIDRSRRRPRIASTVTLSFFFTDTATTEIYTLSLHDALPICR